MTLIPASLRQPVASGEGQWSVIATMRNSISNNVRRLEVLEMTLARKMVRLSGICLTAGMLATAAWSAPNTSVTGTVQQFFHYAPNMPGVGVGEEIFFSLSNRPSTPCPSSGFFGITPATVNDAQTHRNLFAMLICGRRLGPRVRSGDAAGVL